ncbi:uncharacterized protein [Gossypium hirsutum]|uniref:DUF4218 domain-containing protein n=1 Tax=Gossypium hirsutum TaxID=3635 RepID=A0A1U8IDK9_GOSHI|nr:uncharacterized protein LOC107895533 [Gossypium hirsutum]
MRTSPSICTLSQDNEADLRDLITDALEFLNEAFPDGNTTPTTYYEAKNKNSAPNLMYVKIDACPNDCMLYWGDASKKISCDVCKSSMWQSSNKLDADEQVDGSCRRPKPAKVLRYFPLIPRLKRLFQSSKTSQSMRWHKEGQTKDGILRHPADDSAWDAFDKRFPDFASNPRNVRLGLASDEFNPFRTMSTSHSTWPVLLIPYNLEPWACMKQSSLILSMVIPGEKGPGNDIDVYMQPLIKELKQLWTGVDAFDSSASKSFTLRACLLWTINDFPAYANLAGWSTKGQSREFDGTIEFGVALIPQSGEDILREVECVNFIYGKARKRDKEELDEGLIELDVDEGCNLVNNFEELRYNLLRHNLDVMHIEKNVCDNIVGTLLNLSRGGKDNISRHARTYKIWASENLKVLDGYASNISRCVNLKEHKLSNLKSHDGHILMQDLLPICLRGVVEKKVLSVITNLSDFFKRLCAKSLDPQEVDQLQVQVVLTLCETEKIFPPSFFTIMTHLIIHLPMEAKLGGPVQYRYLMGLKALVQNRAYPKGSIAEGYIVSECLTFYSRYFSDVETIFSRPPRNDGYIQKWYIFSSRRRPIDTMNTKILDMRSLAQANRYVLLYSDKLSPYRQ